MKRPLASLAMLTLFGCGTPAQPDAGATSDAETRDSETTEQDAAIDARETPDAAVRDATVSDVASGPVRIADDLTVSSVAVFQGVKVPVFAGGAAVSMRNAPLVASRAAAVRAYVTPRGGFIAHSVTAELTWDDGAPTPLVLRETRTISAASTDESDASVFTFRVDASRVNTRSRYSVRILSATGPVPAAGVAMEGRAPRDGTLGALGVSAAPGAVRITLVPVRWTADRSNRLPDTSAEQLTRFRTLLTALYPVTAVEFTVHAAIDFGNTTLTGNVDFGALNGVLEAMRDRESPADDVYYYALVAPDVSRSAYCGGSCVTGQSYVVNNIGDASIRVGSGVGFAGIDSAWTFVHELGHLFGRYHAPCSTSGADRSYPYSGGAIGVWAWDPRDGTFFAPTRTTDFMGYCDDQWTSDYTYEALYERASSLRAGTGALVSETPPRTVYVAALSTERTLRWLYRRAPQRMPIGDGSLTVRYFDAAGMALGSDRAPIAPLGDAESGTAAHVFVPAAFERATSVELTAPGASAAVRLALPTR